MHRYRHFDDVIDTNTSHTAAILPDIDVDEPFQVQFTPQLDSYPSNFQKFKYHFSRRTRLERSLIFLILILLSVLFIVILISLFHSKPQPKSDETVCLTPSCVQVSYILSSSMNQSVDPCEDFHQFACGNWIRQNLIPKGHSSWSTTHELMQKNMILSKNILEQSSISSLNTAQQESIKFYRSCMNITEIERLNLQPVENFFEKNLTFSLKQWIDINKTQTWQQLFVSLTNILSATYGFFDVLPIKISSDEKNSTWNNIHIDQPKLGLVSRDYYVDSPSDSQSNARNQKIRETYGKVASDILQLFGFEKNDSIKRVNDIIQFETELAAVSLPMEILQKPNETYHLMTVKQLQDQYKSIGWNIKSYLNDMFNLNASNPIKLDDDDQVIVLSYDLMSNVSQIVTKYLSTPNKSHVVIDFILFSLIGDMTSHLPLIFEQTVLPLKKVLLGTDSNPDRWETCVRKTDKALGFGLGALYVNTAFGERDRLKANELIKNIREIFGENLNKLQWIDEQSKSEARKKLDKIYEKIGYPDFIKNDTKLNERYADYSMSESEFFSNELKVRSRERRWSLLQYRQKVDRTEWDMTPETVNAYYNPSENEIVFPAGILQPPFFHKDFPIAINYGGIGSVIGHEITHGFDNQGREFDADGMMRSWWTKFSADNFQEKTKCFVDQYGRFSLDGQNENGQRTLGENIADNGGIKISYLAYQKLKGHLTQSDHNLRLPGLDYTNDQLFFLAFAHTWCNIETTNAMHFDLTNDPHSPARFRIKGTLQNSDEFAKAFDCKSKTMMNPSSKCQLCGSRQEFIDLLCRITKSNDETSATTDAGIAAMADTSVDIPTNEPEVTVIDDTTAAEDGEIITLDDDDDDGEILPNKKEVEDGEITESEESDNDDLEVLNLRLNALRSLPGAKEARRQKPKKSRLRRKQYSDSNRYVTDDIDLRSPNKSRSFRHISQSSNHDDREYLLDKDYRHPSVFDMLVSLISPDNNNINSNTRRFHDNYDIQQMDIDDQPMPAPLPSGPPPPLPLNHMPFFDPLPPLPPPPPMPVFDMFATNQTIPSTNWPRPNFVQQLPPPVPIPTELWQQAFHNPTDTDLRVPPTMNHLIHQQLPVPQIVDRIPHKKASPLQQRRKRTKKPSKKHRHRHEPELQSSVAIPITVIDIDKERELSPSIVNHVNENDEEAEDDLEERLLREQLLRTLSSKRKVLIVQQPTPQPERIVTIEPITSPSPPPVPQQTVIQPTPIVVNKPIEVKSTSQYTIDQRYKRVKANISLTNVTNKTETTTTVVRTTTQPVFQTRNKIVRAPEADLADFPQSNPIIITFDEQTTDDEEQQPQLIVSKPTESTYAVADEERQAIKRLQQEQEEVLRRSNNSESSMKLAQPKVQTPSIEIAQEAIPSTDELSALLEKRRMLLNERSKYQEIQEKMKKKKLENGLFARDIERLEEQLTAKKAKINKNNLFLQYWEKQALAIAQNIRQQEDLILQSAVFKSTQPPSSSSIKPRTSIEFDCAKISSVFDENITQLLLSLLICPLNLYRKLRSYHSWLNRISKRLPTSPVADNSCLLLRTRSFPTKDNEQYWKTCLQSYFIDINQIMCPYELQGSCKAQSCIYQHQHQISSRIEQFLSSKQFDEKNKQKLLNQMTNLCSLQSFDIDFSLFEKKINERQYQRCRTKLDRYLAIYHEDFRYFRDQTNNGNQSIIHPILLSVSNQLDSDDFSVERAVADLVEGLESQRTNAQLWCLYLEFSSWHMSSTELEHLCLAALKNAQSYDLFWTIFYLCTNNLEELISLYFTYVQSDEFDFHSRSYALCELAMFHTSLTSNNDQAYHRIKDYLSNSSLESEHRIYLVLVVLYIFAFGSFPRTLYQQMDENRFERPTYIEPFICPWNALSSYTRSQSEIDQLFDDFMNPLELSESNSALYINRIHYLNATKRFDQSKLYIETLLEAFPCSIELWIELLIHPGVSQRIPEILERARKTTGVYFEFIYSLSSTMNVQQLLTNGSIPAKTHREKFFSELCHLLDTNTELKEKTIEQNLLRYTGELHDIFILHIFLHSSDLSADAPQRLIVKVLNYLLAYDEQQRILILYSFFRLIEVGRVLDIVIDCFLSLNFDRYEWILKSFTYRLLESLKSKERNDLIWIRLDAFIKPLINNSHCQEIYVTILQRLIISTEDKTKIVRLCRLFEKQFPNCGLISQQLRQIIFNSVNTDNGTAITS
ncbi:unnamed protein product [Adineta ricciae]|uniref:Uncharacterized protein n=1 Tax=Adineta ricciae TaxID=249248 RepID=A0A813YFN2_ADIRI|nr:unnamed protein product [Adineta ricciae]